MSCCSPARLLLVCVLELGENIIIATPYRKGCLSRDNGAIFREWKEYISVYMCVCVCVRESWLCLLVHGRYISSEELSFVRQRRDITGVERLHMCIDVGVSECVGVYSSCI